MTPERMELAGGSRALIALALESLALDTESDEVRGVAAQLAAVMRSDRVTVVLLLTGAVLLSDHEVLVPWRTTSD